MAQGQLKAEVPPEALRGAAAEGAVSVSVTGLKKSFGPTRALDGCSFSAVFGEIHAIVGGNGCGKSTLAKVLSGVLPADAGRVSVLGRATLTPSEARDIGVATVFQEVLVADECSVVDNLFMGTDGLLSSSLSAGAKARRGAALMAELAGAPVDVHAPAGALPLNLKQWITIGRALLREPRVLILDESSAALDLDSTERLFARMRRLRDAGGTVLIVTHRIAELIRISDRATVLRDGRDVGVLGRGEITERNLLALMTGKADHAKPAAMTPAAAEAASAGEVMLRLRGVRIWPGAAPLDLDVRRGEVVGVAGLDGQGQSDLVRIVAGVQAAAEGCPEARRPDGSFTPVRHLDEATALGIAYVSGDRKREGIFANLSIFENMLMPLYRRRARGGRAGLIDWKALEGSFNWEVENLLIRMGSRTNRITSLSGGNQQKVLIGRGFATNPDVMVLNDPARGIDVGAKAELYRHLSAFAAQGRAVVYMSSELEEFIGFCSRVLVFRGGALFESFAAAALDPAAILASMFGQRHARPPGEARAGEGGAGPDRGAIKIREFAKPFVRAFGAPAAAPAIPATIRIVSFEDDGPRVTTVDAAGAPRRDAGR